ncbi:MAG: hypothetical protein U0L77_04915, partial [Prevotellamassilia sp.]|nr:hypothetical protein [Prevotellamassilia sp.]
FQSGGIVTENPRYLNNAVRGASTPATPQPPQPMTITKVSNNGTNFVDVPATLAQVVKVQFTGEYSSENTLKRYIGDTLEGTYPIGDDGAVSMGSTIVDEDPIYIRHYRGADLVATVSTLIP